MSKSYIKLGELASYINGYAFKPKDRGSEGLPIIRIQDLTGSSNDKGFYKGTYPSKIEINNGDVLISWSASLGVYVWNNGKALLNQHIFKVVFDKGEIDKDYFVYAVQFSLHRMRQLTHGATMKHVVKKDFENVLIPYPSLKDQRKVAHVLDKLKESINKKMDELTKLDELIKARFVEMFGDPVQNSLNKPMVKLESLGNWKSGGTPARSNPNFYNGNINWFSAGELNSLYLSKSKEKITEEAVQKSSTKLFAKGSMLIGMYDTAAFKMGILKESSCANQACANIKVNEKVNVVWLYYELQAMKEYFLNQRHGVRQKNLTLKMIKKFEIPIFDLNLQNKFANFVQQVDKSKFENIVYLNKTLSSKILSQLGDAIRD
ncbi:restriction endonuclease subunit S [Lactobacillus johnsonii]|uniref:restriction endonuclease subunit S n=1 Tax=Lactobacillus johnsonii TaxID=33959 RepID=UPI00309B063B